MNTERKDGVLIAKPEGRAPVVSPDNRRLARPESRWNRPLPQQRCGLRRIGILPTVRGLALVLAA